MILLRVGCVPPAYNKPEEDARHFYIWFSLHGANLIKEGSRHDFFRRDVSCNCPLSLKKGVRDEYIS